MIHGDHAHCADGWICERHPWLPFPHDECPGAGIACASLEQLLRKSDEASQLTRDIMREEAACAAEQFAQHADPATARTAHLIALKIRGLRLDVVDVGVVRDVDARRAKGGAA
jgi:hypothetical protein